MPCPRYGRSSETVSRSEYAYQLSPIAVPVLVERVVRLPGVGRQDDGDPVRAERARAEHERRVPRRGRPRRQAQEVRGRSRHAPDRYAGAAVRPRAVSCEASASVPVGHGLADQARPRRRGAAAGADPEELHAHTRRSGARTIERCQVARRVAPLGEASADQRRAVARRGPRRRRPARASETTPRASSAPSRRGDTGARASLDPAHHGRPRSMPSAQSSFRGAWSEKALRRSCVSQMCIISLPCRSFDACAGTCRPGAARSRASLLRRHVACVCQRVIGPPGVAPFSPRFIPYIRPRASLSRPSRVIGEDERLRRGAGSKAATVVPARRSARRGRRGLRTGWRPCGSGCCVSKPSACARFGSAPLGAAFLRTVCQDPPRGSALRRCRQPHRGIRMEPASGPCSVEGGSALAAVRDGAEQLRRLLGRRQAGNGAQQRSESGGQ